MLSFNSGSIAYDPNGNMTSWTNSCGTTNYTWDARNRLVAISGYKPDCSALTASFTYDALGRRVSKTINGRTIQYLYDGNDIVQEIESGVPTVNYLRTQNIDEPLARIEANGAVRYYLADALGSVIALTDETGAVVTQYVYEPFGKTTVIGEVSDNAFQYTGRENDGTGLYYYRARYYNPELQRFASEDPIGLDGGDINFYSYTGNNPVNYIDPFGFFGYKPGVPPASLQLRSLLSCIESCSGCKLIITSTTDSHGKKTPHGRGEGVDIKYTCDPDKFLCCAAKCGAGCAIDEKKHPSSKSTGPHFHVQLGKCLGGWRGDLPADKCCK